MGLRSVGSVLHATSVTMEHWTSQHRTFVVEAYFRMAIRLLQHEYQTYCYWAPENPEDLNQRPLHSEKLGVWCGVASSRVIGPYFFETNEGAAVTVTSEPYLEMLHNFCETELRCRGIDRSCMLQF
jgi:hypothetical protein